MFGDNYADCLARAELIAREFFGDDDWEIVRFEASPEAMDVDGTVTLWRAEVAAG